ncbi:hypothetical protein FDV58_37770 [Bradyrhizobium elkanii]|uniref:Uncharacterized protein n=1 Tax=Bradyrhizobium elkanii TaxID=29448 RepID=A0A4U6RHH7_BRAEL|nr:hypothetical protein [Bradyrhizobium elkanii]TKV73303.1 hypothetical protein FDV58_37770 [Bradyrhizobium elkanii]
MLTPGNGTILERLFEKCFQIPFDLNFRRLSRRRRHHRYLRDDLSQGLCQPVVTFRKVAGDQLIQPIQITKILVDDLRMHGDDLRRFLRGGESGLCSLQGRPQRRHTLAGFFLRDDTIGDRVDKPVDAPLGVGKPDFQLRPGRRGPG